MSAIIENTLLELDNKNIEAIKKTKGYYIT
jgi:hypothetical protein